MFKLCTKPTQFTRGKTEETLCDITQRYLVHKTDSHHLIDIIVTNKSLPETEQWRVRTKKTMSTEFGYQENITIDILSSKDSSDYNSINDYITNIFNAKTKEDMPNILIICYHANRVCRDLITMFNMFKGDSYILPENKIKFHVSFDEPDANLGVTKKFIKEIKKFIEAGVIIGILFITATPFDNFWETLNKSGIKKLLNLNTLVERDEIRDFDQELMEYRAFKDHNIMEHNNVTKNPLDYINDVFSKNIIDESKRKIIFAPGHLFTTTTNVGSHEEVLRYFNIKGYCVLIMNGLFKGFVYPDNSRVDIKEFNFRHGVTGELRDTLAKWNEIYPTMNLAITGYWVIERGITFNTTGFNFTDMILSNYHLSSKNKLIQLAGRGTGGKKYVERMNVICTTEIKNTILELTKTLEEICSLNPKYFNKTDFALSTNKNTIPVKVTITDGELLERIAHICNNKVRGYKQTLHEAINQGIINKHLTLCDRNNVRKFDILARTLKDVRTYKDGDKVNARRFESFSKAYENYKGISQSSDDKQYNIDLAINEYVNNGFVNPTNILWITYKY
ncbi:MAG: hypothetical protein CMI56_02525 [Parcubacteria group bacterium]|nr:hypothetical protein [Parcubacteria group bacterium]|tara:strand:+ start:585 stop:2273 length:1689 start_codon:yes stop_codon:yes gene_type:complete